MFIRDIQPLLATGIIPIIKQSELLKSHISKHVQAKTRISDAITLLGQAQFNLSLRKRYTIRHYLKKKYSNLYSLTTPVTSFSFGDDVQKEIKECVLACLWPKISIRFIPTLEITNISVLSETRL